MGYLLITLAIVCNSAASVLMKLVSAKSESGSVLNFVLSLAKNWQTWIGLPLYGLTFVFYIAALKYLPLNTVQPAITAGAISLVSIAAMIFFGESLGLAGSLGLCLIIAGVLVLTLVRN